MWGAVGSPEAKSIYDNQLTRHKTITYTKYMLLQRYCTSHTITNIQRHWVVVTYYIEHIDKLYSNQRLKISEKNYKTSTGESGFQLLNLAHLSIRLFESQQLSSMFFPTSCAHIHLAALPVKHWPIAGALRAVSQTMTHHTVRFVHFFKRTCVPRVPKMINYIFSMHLQLSNGRPLSLQQGPMLVAFY